jgi:hypothetical protein
MAVSELQLYLILKEKLGEKDAQTLVEYIVEKTNETNNLKKAQEMEEINRRAKKAASDLKKWERIAAVTVIVVYLIVIGLYFKK